MPKTRISLALPTIPREPNTNKDAVVKNAYIDNSQTGVSYAVKRPGFYAGLEGITTGTNKGVFWNPNPNNPGIFIINSLGELVFYPYLGNGTFGFMWASGTSYVLGDGPVFYEEDGELTGPWYAQAPNTNIPPSTNPTDPGGILWSFSQVGDTLYVGTYKSLNGPTAGTANAAGYSAYAAHEPYNSCANRFLPTNGWQTYAGISGNNIMAQQWGVATDCNDTPVNLGIAPYGTVSVL
jgi:hypothetical protein